MSEALIPPLTRFEVLDKVTVMFQALLSIKGLKRYSHPYAEDYWLYGLGEENSWLTVEPRCRIAFRNLLHTLLLAFDQRVFITSYRWRRILHDNLIGTHEQSCEQDNCPWIGHQCDGIESCALLPVVGDSSLAQHTPTISSADLTVPADTAGPHRSTVTAHSFISRIFDKLLRLRSELRHSDEESGIDLSEGVEPICSSDGLDKSTQYITHGYASNDSDTGGRHDGECSRDIQGSLNH